ncbi:MAG: hypothetical protein ACR2LQ_07170 [Acidimicrobiales bacterium]
MAASRATCYEAGVLADGTYDVFVVDAAVEGDQTNLELTILAGERKGEIVAVRAVGLGRDELDLLGLPATLTVEKGVPTVAIDDKL